MKNNDKSAWVYKSSDFSLQYDSLSEGVLSQDEILVENEVAGINPVDWKLIQSNPFGWEDGHVPGVDGVGIIVKVGKNVDEALLGKRVAYHQFLKRQGSFARYTVLNSERVMNVPAGMSSELASSLPCPMLTAWQAFQKIPTHNPKNALVVGVGAVNKILIQLLTLAGFKVDVVSKSFSIEEADRFDVREIYRDKSDVSESYFSIFDAVNEQSASHFVTHLKANGHIVAIQGRVAKPIDPPFTRTISYHEIALGALHEFGDAEDWRDLMEGGEGLMDLILSNQLRVEDPVVFEFSKLPQALKHSEETKLKTIVKFD